MKYSIIITTYNKASYIKKCIDSVMNQTIKDFKVIIVDDGSTDNTKEILKPYLKNKNIEYYYKKNTGVADSRNFGISKVKTKYFMFIDSDDYISDTLIEEINKYKDYDVLSFKGIKISEEGQEIKRLEKSAFNSIVGTKYLYDLMEKGHFFLVPWGYVYNTEFWKKHNFLYTKNYVMEDAGLTPIVILNAKKIVSIDYYGYYYVQSQESIMRTEDEEKIKLKTKSILYQYDTFTEYVNSKDYNKELKESFNNYFAKLVLWYGSTLKNKDLKSYSKEMKKRDIVNKLKNKALTTTVKIILCKIDYRLFFLIHRMLYPKEDK